MPEDAVGVLTNSSVRQGLLSAWLESDPGLSGGHEEGFITIDEFGHYLVTRWPRGEQNRIEDPRHTGCKFEQREIVASFHTHPNTGPDFLQEPSETDKRSLRDDPDLKGTAYKGEFVISNERIYRISPDGEVSDMMETSHPFDSKGEGQ
jgi:hypothetical protein